MKAEILQSFIEKIWNEGDVDAAGDFIADKYTVFHDPGDPWEGQELDLAGFKNRVTVSRASAPDQTFDIKEIYENENSVCLTWLWSGTHQGEIANFPPSGKTLHMSGSTVYYFLNNKITGHWQVADRFSIYQQLQEIASQQI
ncbi:MAG: ester cyclase [Acidiferrobacterales bacterium]|nr:ester cyclase [Acidiferrobacterales bacterium]